MRAVELYRRPPFLTGDEAAVTRWSRTWRARRNWTRVALAAGYAGLGAAAGLRLVALDVSLFGFAGVTFLFAFSFLFTGARMAMRPMEFYEDGVVGTQLGLPLGRRRFVRWREVLGVSLADEEGLGNVLRVAVEGAGVLRSVPGEFTKKEFAVIEGRVEQGKAPKSPEPPAGEKANA